MYFLRKIENDVRGALEPGKVMLLYGPRRVGKTTLLQRIMADVQGKKLFLNGEDSLARQDIESLSVERMKNYLGEAQFLFIDEAQKIRQAGLALKLLVDSFPQLVVFATGSSAFDLQQQTGEPLLGRKKTFILYPLAESEVRTHIDAYLQVSKREENLIYGFYPEVITQKSTSNRQEYLRELTQGALYKDILELDGIRYASKIVDLLRLVAFQIGREVSLTELSNQLNLNRKTVEKYLDLLEKSFVLYGVRGLSRNLRSEVTKSQRYYFYDLGIRNALINNFNPINLRNDVGELWENYTIIERIKRQAYERIYTNNYFWRTYSQAEIDWVEEREGKLFGYEIKWNPKKNPKAPKAWTDNYPEAGYEVIHPGNIEHFIG
jgi:uncharacterized protein